MPLKNHNYVVILAGGSGTRLWPRSRESTPKQFLKIASDKTMLQLTYQRALSVVPKEQIIISTNQKHAAMVKEQLPEYYDRSFSEPTLYKSEKTKYDKKDTMHEHANTYQYDGQGPATETSGRYDCLFGCGFRGAGRSVSGRSAA